ncbi:MAG: ABC transporter ATP-binding protein [Chloroflexota bacterium]
MVRLVKYLKPYWALVLLSIVLLFVQAMCNLALPDYLSQIVNDGIQQGGVTEAAPAAIRQSEMNRVTIFLNPQDESRVLSDYELVGQNSPDYAKYVQDYPALATQSIYVRKDLSGAERAWLDPVIGRALLATGSVEQMMADPAKAAAAAQGLGFDLSQLPPGTDIFTVLANLPAAQRTQLVAAVDKQFQAMDPSMVTQMAARMVKTEYQALGMDTGSLQNDYILHTGALMLAVSLLAAVAVVAVSYLSARTAAGLARDVRRALFQRVESFSSTEFDRFSTASLITRSTNDITQIQMLVIMAVRLVFFAPIMGVGGIIRAVGKSPNMWWIIAVAVITLVGLVMIVFSISLPKFRRIQGLVDRLNLVTRENLSGMMVIRAFNQQDFELERFDRANQDLTGTMLFVNRVMVFMFPAMVLIMNGLSIGIVWVGSHQVAQSNIQVGDMMAFLQYAMQIVFSFLMLSMMFIILPRASVAGDRVAEVLATEPAIRDPQRPERFADPFHGVIEFRNVSFRYPGAEEDVLHDLTFTANPGQTTAFIGATGAGKSTLVNLIPRFYDVTGGSICLDGTDIRQVAQHALRDKIGYVPQKAMLFSGTIESNLRYADENAPAEALASAAEIAQASEFIDSRPEGLALEIAQGGMNVSGGQKQRLSIARALVKKPPVYIFDDSFSALDFKTDATLRRALKEHTGSSTVLLVTQRVSTVMNADQIVVLDEGRIVGKGTHRDLLERCEAYREIASSQLSKEELA